MRLGRQQLTVGVRATKVRAADGLPTANGNADGLGPVRDF